MESRGNSSLMQFRNKQAKCSLSDVDNDENKTYVKTSRRTKIIQKSPSSSVKISARKRMSLTIEKKLEIIQRHAKGETQKALAESYKVGR